MKLKLLFCWLTFAGVLFAQKPTGALTNQKVGDLVVAGVSTSEVIRIISSAPAVSFDLRPGSTDNLLSVGVSEEIIKAMAARESGEMSPPLRRSPEIQPSQVQQVSDRPPVSEMGVYYRDASVGPWTRLMPELANWKTGGVLKGLATSGIVKRDINGRISGPSSRNHLGSTTEILIYCPAGTEITEYQLLKLRKHSKAREFRTVTGGIFHQSGGSDRDLVSFDPKSFGPGAYTITLSGLSHGQYGIMPPGSYESHGPSAQLGKVYTFSVSE